MVTDLVEAASDEVFCKSSRRVAKVDPCGAVSSNNLGGAFTMMDGVSFTSRGRWQERCLIDV